MRKFIVGLLSVALLAGMVTPAFADTTKHVSKSKKAVSAKPVFVQHPYSARQKYKVGRTIKVSGYVAPKASSLTSRTIEILVYKQTGARSWELTQTISGSLYNRARIRHRTLYKASFSLDATGRYRMRARYTWEAADGTKRVRYSSYKYFRIVK
jgi:hypothetical protein